MDLFFRVSKALIMGLLTYIGVKLMGFSVFTSLIIAIIPVALGFVNVLAGLTYSIAGIVFIIGVLYFALGDKDISVADNLAKIVKIGNELLLDNSDYTKQSDDVIK